MDEYVLRFTVDEFLSQIEAEAGRDLSDEETQAAVEAVKNNFDCGSVYDQFSELVRTHTDIFE